LPTADPILSACADEAADSPDDQARFLLAQAIRFMDVRRVWRKTPIELADDEALAVKRAAETHGLALHCLYSDACRSPVDTPLDDDLARLGRLLELAALMQARYVRVFSFVPPNQEKSADHLFAAMRRMRQIGEMAVAAGVTLLVENATGTVGNIPSNIHSILHACNSPLMRLAWNPAEFVRTGVAAQVEDFWLMLARFTTCVVLQDARLDDGTFALPGHGDGQVHRLLRNLHDQGYQGSVSILPPAPSEADTHLGGADRLLAQILTARNLLKATGLGRETGQPGWKIQLV
jgi:sugar phosphate isomerase/epimerase